MLSAVSTLLPDKPLYIFQALFLMDSILEIHNGLYKLPFSYGEKGRKGVHKMCLIGMVAEIVTIQRL